MTPTELRDQRRTAARMATDYRAARGEDRCRMRNGSLLMSQVVADPPVHWSSTLLYQALLMAPWFGRHKLRTMNAVAVRQGVNLCAPLDGLPPRGREWVLDYLRERGL